MKAILLIGAALASATAMVADAPNYVQQNDVRIFERADITGDLAITAFGIMRDTRCTERVICFREDRLVVAAIVQHRGRDREFALELGQPVQLDGGVLTLVSTSTPPSDAGAIPLKYYRLNFRWQPD